MKLNKIHQDLKDLYKDKDSVKTILGAVFEKEDEIERCMDIFNAGYWSVAPFAFEPDEIFAIQLNPKTNLKESNIVLGDESGFVTFSHSLSAFIPFLQLEMLKNPKFIKYILEDWESLVKLSQPLMEYTEEAGMLDFLNAFLHDEAKLKYLENPEKHYDRVYLDFWNHYYNTPQQKAYAVLMQALVDDSSYLPDFELKDYGAWTTRLYNALAQRAYSKVSSDTVVKFEKYNFQSFIQPHGFDPVDLIFGILPHSTRSSYTLDGIIDFFDTNPGLGWEYAEKIKGHPLFEVGEIIKNDKSSYDGSAHITAAKILDEKLGDPVMAWDALVSAGYWSGVNFNEPNMAAWKAAIDLSEKHGWKEINEVLRNQLEFYNHYK